jgi:hypothetical protein
LLLDAAMSGRKEAGANGKLHGFRLFLFLLLFRTCDGPYTSSADPKIAFSSHHNIEMEFW